jgi:hypothetical protein
MGIIPALGLSSIKGWSSHSWLLTPLLGDTASRIISVVLFLLALVGFLVAALGLMGWLVPHDLWRTLVIASAVISLFELRYWTPDI